MCAHDFFLFTRVKKKYSKKSECELRKAKGAHKYTRDCRWYDMRALESFHIRWKFLFYFFMSRERKTFSIPLFWYVSMDKIWPPFVRVRFLICRFISCQVSCSKQALCCARVVYEHWLSGLGFLFYHTRLKHFSFKI